ncbi:MAG: sulfotransferase [Desulfohalobiaceae bacterium]
MNVKDMALKNKRDFASRIIKEPFLTLFYDCLVEHFPKAQFLFLVRDPVENIRSILNRAGYKGRYDPEARLNLSLEWRSILSGAYISPCCKDVLECLALRWNIMSSIYLDNQENIRLCRYEDFVQDKIKSLQDLCLDLGLPIMHELEHKLELQYQKKGETGAGRQSFFSPEETHRIESICKANMQSLGYC